MNKDTKAKISSSEFNKIFTDMVKGKDHTKIDRALLMDDQYLSELGKIVRNFEVISWNLQQFIVVANNGEFDTMLLSELSFKKTVRLVCEFFKKFEIYNTDIRSILKKEFSNAEEIRNLILHSLWTGGEKKNGQIIRHKLSKIHMGFYNEVFLHKDLVDISDWFKKLIIVSKNLVYEIGKIKKTKK